MRNRPNHRIHRTRGLAGRLGRASFGAALALTTMFSGAPLPALAADAVSVSISGTPAVVFPAMDTGTTSVSFRYYLSRSSNVTVDVVDASQTTVRTLVSGQSTPDHSWRDVGWDLRAANGLLVPDGLYTLRVSAVAGDGGTGEVSLRTGIDRRAAPAVTGVGSGAQVSGTLSLALDALTGLTLSNVRFTVGDCATGPVVAAPDQDGRYHGTVDVGACAEGATQVGAIFNFTDALGHVATHRSVQVPVTVLDVADPVVVGVPAGRTLALTGPGAYESWSGTFSASMTSPASRRRCMRSPVRLGRPWWPASP